MPSNQERPILFGGSLPLKNQDKKVGTKTRRVERGYFFERFEGFIFSFLEKPFQIPDFSSLKNLGLKKKTREIDQPCLGPI